MEGEIFEQTSFAGEATFETSDIATFEPNGHDGDLEAAGDAMSEGGEPEAPGGSPPFERAHERAVELEGRRSRRGRRRGRRGGRRDRDHKSFPEAGSDEEQAPEPAAPRAVAPVADDVVCTEPAPDVASHDDFRGEAEIEPAPSAAAIGDDHEGDAVSDPTSYRAELTELVPEPTPPADESAIRPEPLSPPREPVLTPRTAPVASEPIIERVLVRPDSGAEPTVESPKPARKGWWQRRFGSE
jgi:hypothetical protein